MALTLAPSGSAQAGKPRNKPKDTRSAPSKPPQKRRVEISDRSLYSEAIFAEVFEKDLAKATKLLEQLLARQIQSREVRRDAEYRYMWLLLSSVQLDRYRAHLKKHLERKDLTPKERDRLKAVDHMLRVNGTEIKKWILKNRKQLDEAKGKSAKEREAVRQKHLGDLKRYMNQVWSSLWGMESRSRDERDRRFARQFQRVQSLQEKIDKLQKEHKGNSKEAQRLRRELLRAIKRDSQSRKDPRRTRRNRMWMMRGFFSARKQIAKSGNRKRLLEFDKLSREVEKLLRAGQYQKANARIRSSQKRFPELKRQRKG